MSVRVKHLNGDSSFLFIFTPSYAGPNSSETFPGSFTVLVDPWLVGDATILSPKFAQTIRTIPACLTSLADIPDPDVIIISQDKPDHCHRETLTQLSPFTTSKIYAPAAAAKRMRSWKHFEQNTIHTLDRWEDDKDSSVVRIPIPSFSHTTTPGEVTLSLIAPRLDLSGLHNAICITYRAPSSVLSAQTSRIHLPITPPTTPPSSINSNREIGVGSPTASVTSLTQSISEPRPLVSKRSLYLRSPEQQRETAVSVLYSPHGLTYNHIKPFASQHLVSEAALPLTALLHSFTRIDNPWYFGGNINTGSGGGVEIAKNLAARCWIGAHDEETRTSGASTLQMKKWKSSCDDIRRLLDEGPERVLSSSKSTSSSSSTSGMTTELVELDTGSDICIQARSTWR